MRNRSVAIVVRNGAVLVEKTYYEGRYFYALPGGGIEEGESPEETALRELKEECGLDGKIIKPLNIVQKKDRAFLWAYGLMEVEEFWDEVQSWGDEISYPKK